MLQERLEANVNQAHLFMKWSEIQLTYAQVLHIRLF